MQIAQILNKIKLKLFKRLIDLDLNNNNKIKKVESKIANKTDEDKTRNKFGFPQDLEE